MSATTVTIEWGMSGMAAVLANGEIAFFAYNVDVSVCSQRGTIRVRDADGYEACEAQCLAVQNGMKVNPNAQMTVNIRTIGDYAFALEVATLNNPYVSVGRSTPVNKMRLSVQGNGLCIRPMRNNCYVGRIDNIGIIEEMKIGE